MTGWDAYWAAQQADIRHRDTLRRIVLLVLDGIGLVSAVLLALVTVLALDLLLNGG